MYTMQLRLHKSSRSDTLWNLSVHLKNLSLWTVWRYLREKCRYNSKFNEIGSISFRGRPSLSLASFSLHLLKHSLNNHYASLAPSGLLSLYPSFSLLVKMGNKSGVLIFWGNELEGSSLKGGFALTW